MYETKEKIRELIDVMFLLLDSFDYGIAKSSYNKELYYKRQSDYNKKISSSSLFFKILDEFEKGKEIKNNFIRLQEMIYGSNKTYVYISNNSLNVNLALAYEVVKYLIGLHETTYLIVLQYVEKLDNIKKEIIDQYNFLYRAYIGYILIIEIDRIFWEYNKALDQYNDYKEFTTSRSIDRINEICNSLKFVIDKSNINDYEYLDVINSTKKYFDLIFTTGNIPLKEYNSYFSDAKNKWENYLKKYSNFRKEYIENLRKQLY